jgi:hypothetical protein
MPTDFELAPAYGYLPMIDGWVAAKEGFNPGSWIPPNGYSPSGAYGPPMAPWAYKSPGPLGDAASDAVIAAMTAQNQKVFTLSVITTIAVVISASLATFRTAKEIRKLRRSGH